MSETQTLAFEIGTEEIPAFDLDSARRQLPTIAAAAFGKARITTGPIEAFTTPRRLIVLAHGVATTTAGLTEEYKGPSAALAFDAAGAPTKAAAGFAAGKGIAVSELERRTVGGTEYVFATKTVAPAAAADLLPDVLTGMIGALAWPKSCRWGTQEVLFTRPVRWLLALFGADVVEVRYAGLVAGRTTQGHRVLAPGAHAVTDADSLLDVLAAAYVVPGAAAREEAIRAGVATIEAESGLHAALPPATLLEVVNLTEYPTPLLCSFDAGFLKVPAEIIVDAMLKHQRYFPLYDAEERLTNRFIAVSNGDPAYGAIIAAGNEKVVRPRLADAKFFYEEDLKHPLESLVGRLDGVVFQETLGSVRAKTDRIVALSGFLADAAGVGPQEAADARRAAYLCKADLVSNAVIEFTSVQGVMGAYYALASGENAQVAEAIADHYRPRFADDEPPRSQVGRLVATADKLDTICGLFAIGQGPSGSSDPFALRRAGIGIVNMLAAGLPVTLAAAIQASLATFGSLEFDRDAAYAAVMDFFTARTKAMLKDAGLAADVIEAVFAAGVVEPAEAIARARTLARARAETPEAMDDLAVAYARANNLRDPSLGPVADPALFGPAEAKLLDAVEAVDGEVRAGLAGNDYARALAALAALRGPIDSFFEEVLVMDKDEAIKANRLRLLNRFVDVFADVADFGKMAKPSR